MSKLNNGVTEKCHGSIAVMLRRATMLDKAGALVGKARLAEYAGIEPRTFRSYTSVERECPISALTAAADGIDKYCDDLRSHAERLRKLAEGQ